MRTFTLSIGNTSLFGGVFTDDKPGVSSRAPVREAVTTAGFDRFVAEFARRRVDQAVLCSVVPMLTKNFSTRIQSRFGIMPRLLTTDELHGLNIDYHDPRELGADRLAAALGAQKLFPGKDTIVVDCGTATTITVLRRDGTLLGGAIFPGLSLWSEMLATRTAQLPEVTLDRPRAALGRSTREGLQSGIFHGHTGAMRELVAKLRAEAFGSGDVEVVGTGGGASRFAAEKVFSVIVPELVLTGLNVFARRTEEAEPL